MIKRNGVRTSSYNTIVVTRNDSEMVPSAMTALWELSYRTLMALTITSGMP
jgi:hypothetical protein